LPGIGMALSFAVEDLVKATLPSGWGQAGFVGVSPGGDSYHVLVPVDLDLAEGTFRMALHGWAEPLGGRPGWRYYYCRTYDLPPKDRLPWLEALMEGRLRRAVHSGELLVSWARQQGWWAELSL
jgi:hypothetical protein